ncbi:MAG: two-component sensor histidine kinase [Betaproteobacteria bacterium]|nr:MAG: two-component sensor histidine kinase [Betaproteobacteria bacterium]
MNSIRRQLLLWQITALLLTGLLVSVMTYSITWSGFNKTRDYTLEQVAHAIMRHGVETVGPDGRVYDEAQDQGRFMSQIWERKKLVYASRPEVALPRQADGFAVVLWAGEEWRTYTVHSAGLTIQVASPVANRVRAYARLADWLLLPLAVLVAGLGLLIWMAVVRALAPLEQVRREIGVRDVAMLQPIDLTAVPEEIRPLGDALNGLLDRLSRALSLQRRFVADAAHELRTPLTALKLQAQMAARAGSEAERRQALARLQEGIDRAAHLVSQLLVMARLEPEAEAEWVALDLDALVKQVLIDLSPVAESRSIDLGLTDTLPLSLIGHAEPLRVLVSNLIDNAVRYTPVGGRVDVALQKEGHAAGTWALLTISDTGPGIPLAERERVFRRFYRLAGTAAPGSGLGLAIVREIVRRCQGQIVLLDAPGGGLRVEVRLPM